MRRGLAYELGGALAFLVGCGDGASPAGDGGTGTAGSGAAGTTGAAGAGTAGTGGTGTVGTGGTGTAGTGGSAPLSFAADIWPVFDQVRDPPWKYYGTGSYAGCTTGGVCHGGPNPGAGMSMTAADSAYRVLIDVPSVSSLCAGTIRVIAGDPERSCLVRFYEGRLRDELGWVGQAEIDLVRSWIADGARP